MYEKLYTYATPKYGFNVVGRFLKTHQYFDSKMINKKCRQFKLAIERLSKLEKDIFEKNFKQSKSSKMPPFLTFFNLNWLVLYAILNTCGDPNSILLHLLSITVLSILKCLECLEVVDNGVSFSPGVVTCFM